MAMIWGLAVVARTPIPSTKAASIDESIGTNPRLPKKTVSCLSRKDCPHNDTA